MPARMLVPLLLALTSVSPGADAAWQALFDGKSLGKWQPTAFSGQGKVRVENETIALDPGAPLTGITWTAPFPKSNYEIRFEAVRLKGNDFFATLTFPVKDAFCTWVAGGWGGDIVGLSSLDGWDASENETRTYFTFENNRWYAFLLRVTDERITASIDGSKIVDVEITGRAISLRRGDIKLSTPLGFASYATAGAIRKISFRKLE